MDEFASIFSSPRASLLRTIVFARQARRRGARARIPFSFRWEDALAQPLAELRQALGSCGGPESGAPARRDFMA